MTPKQEKLDKIKQKFINKIHDRTYWKHILAAAGIAAAAGIVASLFISGKTTVNDIAIRYTEAPAEELDTEGYSGEEVQEDIPSEPAPEETSVPVETQAQEMAYIPEVQIKTTMLSTMHRPWILSRLSDMFHSLSAPR